MLDVIAPRIVQLDQRLRTEFAALAHVADIRQWGMMVGIELMRDPQQGIAYEPHEKIGIRVITEARKRGVIIRPLGGVIILMPPLSITESELTRLLDITYEAIQTVTAEGR